MATPTSDHIADIPPLFIRMRNLPGVVGLSRAEIYRQVRKGTFPRPVSLGGASKGWRMADIKAWADSLPYRSLD